MIDHLFLKKNLRMLKV